MLAGTIRQPLTGSGLETGGLSSKMANWSNNDLLLHELYRDARAARQQLDAKSGDLVTAMQALQQTEQTLREVIHGRQSMNGEIRLLRHEVAELRANEQAEVRQSEECEEQQREWEQRYLISEQRHRMAEVACDELRGRLLAYEGMHATSELRLEEAQRSAAEARHEAAESVQHAHEAERHWQQQAEEQMQESKLVFTERESEQRQASEELRRTALQELQRLSKEQETLRTELRRVMRPPPAVPYLTPAVPGNTHLALPAYEQKTWDEALERVRARVAIDRGASAWRTPLLPHHHGRDGGSLLTGKMRKMTDFIDSQLPHS